MTSTPTRPVENVVIATKGLHDRNNLLLDGRTVENKSKLILSEDRVNSRFILFYMCSIGERSEARTIVLHHVEHAAAQQLYETMNLICGGKLWIVLLA